MNNYAVNHRLQFSSNVAGNYKFAVLADTVITGSNSSIGQLRYFLNRATASEITNVLHLGPALSREDVTAWPRIPGLTTWCLTPPPPAAHNGGSRRSDLVAAPTGFVLIRRGRAVPVFLHYRPGSPVVGIGDGVSEIIGGETTSVHLVGGGSCHGFQELPDGGLVVSVGTFPPVGALVELWFGDDSEIKCEAQFIERGD